MDIPNEHVTDVNRQQQAERAPRVIKITDASHVMLLRKASQDFFLTPENISMMVANFELSLQRMRTQQSNELRAIVAELFPETRDGDWVFDPMRLVIVEHVNNGNNDEGGSEGAARG